MNKAERRQERVYLFGSFAIIVILLIFVLSLIFISSVKSTDTGQVCVPNIPTVFIPLEEGEPIVIVMPATPANVRLALETKAKIQREGGTP